ncbi:MAG: peptidoglycan bridge formation glycyltransferase FemA/FemB family protein [Bacteroidia bacterium]|nr:peptidoglycan bridge formation glycyltransferase FemA/FemB family protein [Bacteroidia bacterium]
MIPLVGRWFKVSRAESSVILSNAVIDKEAVKKAALTELFTFLKLKNVIYFTITPKVRTSDSEVYNQLDIHSSRCGTYILDLTIDINDIYRGFSKGCKSSIQKAIKSEVEVRFYTRENAREKIPEYLILQNSLMERRKEQFSALYIKSNTFYLKIFNQDFSENILALAYFHNKPAAGAIITVYNNKMFYYQGASDYELTKESQATNLLQYEIIKYGKTNNYIQYDLGGADLHLTKESPLYGVYSFKKSFGGQGAEFDAMSIVLNKHRFNFIWKMKNLQNSSIVKCIFKLLKK